MVKLHEYKCTEIFCQILKWAISESNQGQAVHDTLSEH